MSHPCYKLLIPHPTNPRSGRKDNVICRLCDKSMTGKSYRFVGHFCPELRNRGVALCQNLHLADHIILNEVRKSCLLSLLHTPPSSDAPPVKQPRIDDGLPKTNSYNDNCDFALVNMLTSCALPLHIVDNPEFKYFCTIVSENKYIVPSETTIRQMFLSQAKKPLNQEHEGEALDQ
ncbi:hypothetical protein P9112_002428 [Eukaryota sp. TZLM1-RC]